MITTTIPGFEVVARKVDACRTSWGVGIQAHVPAEHWDAAVALIPDAERRKDAELFLSHVRARKESRARALNFDRSYTR